MVHTIRSGGEGGVMQHTGKQRTSKNEYDDLNIAYTGIKLSTALMIKSSTYCVFMSADE